LKNFGEIFPTGVFKKGDIFAGGDYFLFGGKIFGDCFKKHHIWAAQIKNYV